MKISIDVEALYNRGLSLEEFLVILPEYFNVDYGSTIAKLTQKGIAEKNLYGTSPIVLSDNTRDLIAKCLIDSEDSIINNPIDFTSLAYKLQQLYPKGTKPGTTYSWRGNTDDIAFKLKVLVVKHHFTFTEKEAIAATKEYVSSYEHSDKYLQLLKYFILKTTKEGNDTDISSLFMTIIENNRKKDEMDNR